MCGFRCSFHLLLTSFFAFCWLLIARYLLRDEQPLHIHVPKVDLTSIAVDNRKSRFHVLQGNANLACPFVGSACRDSADDAVALGVHHTIDDLIERSITTVREDEIIALFSGVGCKLHALPAVGFQGNIGTPPCRRQHSINVGNFCQVFSISEIYHQTYFSTLHEATPYAYFSITSTGTHCFFLSADKYPTQQISVTVIFLICCLFCSLHV